MLLLSRKLHEKIVIGRDIELTVVGIRGGRVLIGISAPRETEVKRGELRPPKTTK